jgi:hypothetical protein
MPSQQHNWRFCRKCQGLFFAGHSKGVCPAGGSHDDAGSGDYVLNQNPRPGHRFDDNP